MTRRRRDQPFRIETISGAGQPALERREYLPVEPSWRRDVLAPVALVGALAIIGIGVAADNWRWGIGAGVILAIIVFGHRQALYDQRAGLVEVEETEHKQPERVIAPMVAAEDRRTIRYGQLAYTDAQWQRLADAIEANDGRVAREAIARARVLTNVTASYPAFIGELRRLGLADDLGKLTEAGEDWFFEAGWENHPTP